MIFRKTEVIFRKIFVRTKHRNWFSVKRIPCAAKHLNTFSFPENSIFEKWNIFRKCFYATKRSLKWSNWKSQAQNDNQLNLKDVIIFLPKNCLFWNLWCITKIPFRKRYPELFLPPLIGRWPKEIDVETYCELPRYLFRKGLAPHVWSSSFKSLIERQHMSRHM